MVQIDTNNQVLVSKDIYPRLCVLHKWSDYDGYGIHLTCNEDWHGLHIDHIESNSPAENAGLLRDDIIFAVNGRSIENEDFFVILSFIRHELEYDQIQFLVLDPHSAKLAQREQIKIDENHPNCIRRETAKFMKPLFKTTVQNSSNEALDDLNYNSKRKPRLCSITLRPGAEPLGISLQSDTDFSHIITHVQLNSPAARAGIEQGDCIISLNNTPLLHISFEDVVYFLAKCRNNLKLDFLLAKKSYLLQSSQDHLASNSYDQLLSSEHLLARKRSLTLPATKTLYEPSKTPREKYDSLSLHMLNHLHIGKHKKRPGKVVKGIGPATGLRFSWSTKSEKTTDYSSIHSDQHSQRTDLPNLLQVGMTNPSPKPLARRIISHVRSVSFSDDTKRVAPLSSVKRLYHTPNRHFASKGNHVVHTPPSILKHKRNIIYSVPNSPVSSSHKLRMKDQDNFQDCFHLARIPITELSNHGYELHNLKLMKPTETVPVGFKLSKKLDPLQYLMTVVVEQSKADIAGLKVNDWLLQIEDKDIRLTPLRKVLEDIYHSFNTVGFINMRIARKKSSPVENPPTTEDSIVPSSVGLSNPIEAKTEPPPKETSIAQPIDSNLDKIRRITLNGSSGLYFNSFVSDDNDQIQIHFIQNIQPISNAYRSGLRNHDRILTVNDIDVTRMSPEDLRLMILKTKPIELTVIKDSKHIESIEIFKRNRNPKNSSETTNRRQSIEFSNILFTDEKGPVLIKHCVVKKEAPYDALGFLLYYEDSVHVIDNMELNFPAYKSGLRNRDVILFVNKKSVQQLSHDDLTILLRSLTIANQNIDLITINEKDVQRYKNYQRKRFIDWHSILSKIDDYPMQMNARPSLINQQPSGSYDPSSLLVGARVCILETDPTRLIGFTIEGVPPPPFTICKIEKDSSAERAGLQINDALLSINGKSLLQSTHEETIAIIKEALQQKIIQFVVNQSPFQKSYRPRRGSDSSSLSYSSYDDESIDDSTIINAAPIRNKNAVQEYQKQRTKELSYAVRLCHLNTTNADGTRASSFGFELNKNSEYEYPIITHVESKSPGERSGLQVDDIVLKVNKRKTKGANIDKVRKLIDKAKNNGRIEVLVIDKEAFHYCLKTNRKFKEPYIKVKHIFPRSRSSVTYQSVPLMAARASMTSQQFSTQLENEEDDSKLTRFDEKVVDSNVRLSTAATSNAILPDIASKFMDPARRLSQRIEPALFSNTTQSNDESFIDFVLNAVNNFFQNLGSEKPINLDYDVPPDRTNNSKIHTPIVPTYCPDLHLRKDLLSNVRMDSNQSIASYDYIRDPRRCVLQIDREKGLGFVLSATGDYDHTITSVDKYSVADIAGLQVHDEVVEINGVDVRNIKYEQVVEMLISAMRIHDTIEMSVLNTRTYPSTPNTSKTTNTPSLSNTNNNNNNLITGKRTSTVSGNEFSDKNNKINSFDAVKQETVNTSHPDLHDSSKYLNYISRRGLSGSVPLLSTGITASPKDFRLIKTPPTSPKKDPHDKVSNFSKNKAPVARLCRIRKFPSSPFYGFFLCGDAKKLGRVFVSDIAKNSSAAICGLRDGDHIIEVNGINIQTLTYETILNKIRLHMEHENLELLVLDKKSERWYRRRKYPITSQTLPTIVHIEPIINQINTGMESS